MATVIVQAVASLDGFIARPDDLPGPIFDWYEAGDVDADVQPRALFHVSRQSRRLPGDIWPTSGCQVIGRHLFDFVDGWGGVPIGGRPRLRRDATATPTSGSERYPDAPYTFCTDGIEDAVRRATEHAGDGTVHRLRGEVGGQVVAAGLADELAIDLAPVFLGQGKKFLGSSTDEIVLDDPHVVVQGERVLHLRYRLAAT